MPAHLAYERSARRLISQMSGKIAIYHFAKFSLVAILTRRSLPPRSNLLPAMVPRAGEADERPFLAIDLIADQENVLAP